VVGWGVVPSGIGANTLLNILLIAAFVLSPSPGGRSDNDKVVESHLAKMAQHPDWGAAERVAARGEIVRLGKAAVPALLCLLGSEKVETEAAEALGELVAQDKSLALDARQSDAVGRATERMRYPAVGSLLFVLEELRARGAELAPMIPGLAAGGAKNPDGCARVSCLATLVRLDAAGRDKWVDQLAKLMDTREPGQHYHGTARSALKQLGPLARKLVPALRARLNTDSPWRRLWTADLLVSLDPDGHEEYLGLLLAAMKGPDRAARLEAISYASIFGPLPKAADTKLRDTLKALLADQDAGVSERAKEALEMRDRIERDFKN
jgi:hypothetical protein